MPSGFIPRRDNYVMNRLGFKELFKKEYIGMFFYFVKNEDLIKIVSCLLMFFVLNFITDY